jgi:hypothetical protein
MNALTKVTSLCDVTVNLRNLPASAWKRCNQGMHYEAVYELALIFGAELTMKVMYQGRELGIAHALYN